MFFPRFILIAVATVLGAVAWFTHRDAFAFLGFPHPLAKYFVVGCLALFALSAITTFVLTFGFTRTDTGLYAKENSILGKIACGIAPKLKDGLHFCNLYTSAIAPTALASCAVGVVATIGFCLWKVSTGESAVTWGEVGESLIVMLCILAVMCVLVGVVMLLEKLAEKYPWVKRVFVTLWFGMFAIIGLGALFLGTVVPVLGFWKMGYTVGESVGWYAKILAFALGALPLCMLLRWIVKKLPLFLANRLCPIASAPHLAKAESEAAETE